MYDPVIQADNPLPEYLDSSAGDALQQMLPLPLISVAHAPGQSNALRPSPIHSEVPANYRIISSIDDNRDFYDDGPTDAEFHSKDNSGSGSDSERISMDDTEHGLCSPVPVAQNRSISPAMRDVESDSESDPEPIAESEDDYQSDREFAHNSDRIEEGSDTGDGSGENSGNRKDLETSTRKSGSRQAQGALLS